MRLVEDTPLQREIDQQEQFVRSAVDGFIQRQGDFDQLNAYVADETTQSFAIVALGGLGKSTLLAKWIDHLREAGSTSGQVVLLRFIGASDLSTGVYSLLHSLLEQFAVSTRNPGLQIPLDPQQLRESWIKIIHEKNAGGKTVIVLDAINQLEEGLADLSWLPQELPANIKLVISFKRGSQAAEDLIRAMDASRQARFAEVLPFEALEERRKLVEGYLKPYLKDLGDMDMDQLIRLPGAENPLYLKILLSELRVFGVFSELKNKISAFGADPVSAFQNVLMRLETDPAYSRFQPERVVPVIFGSLAYARHGLAVREIADLLLRELILERNSVNSVDEVQTIQLFMRQVRPFLARRDGCYDFFYESFKLAAMARYTRTGSEESAFPEYSQVEWHHQLANYFQGLPLWLEDKTRVANKRKTAELPFHLAMSAQPAAFTECLGNFDFLYAKLLAFSAPVLLEDFKLAALDGLALGAQPAGALGLIQKAINLSLQNISFDPRLFAGQIIARLNDFDNPILQALVQQAQNWTGEIFIVQGETAKQTKNYCFYISVPNPQGASTSSGSQRFTPFPRVVTACLPRNPFGQRHRG